MFWKIDVIRSVTAPANKILPQAVNYPVFAFDTAKLRDMSADNAPIDQQSVAASQQRLQALVTATADVVYSLSADWEVMRELDGRGFLKDTDRPITGWRSQNVFSGDMEMVNAVIAEAIRKKKIFELEHRVNRADGTT